MSKEWRCPHCNTVNLKSGYILRLSQLSKSLGSFSIGASGEPAPRCSKCDFEADVNLILAGDYDARDKKTPDTLPEPSKIAPANSLDKPAQSDRLAQTVIGGLAAALVFGLCALVIGGGIYLTRSRGDEALPASRPATTEHAAPTAGAPKKEVGQRSESLVFCLVGEPKSLFIYADNSSVAGYVRQVVMDGPIDQVGYEFEPVILEKLPSIENGDVQIKPVTVSRGDMVMDAFGVVKELSDGTQLKDLEGNLFAYQGGLVQTAQYEVTFRLREDVVWSDGMPLTARDSYFSYELATNIGKAGEDFVESTAEYKVVDDWTVMWTSIPGYWSTQPYDGFFLPLPSHVYADIPPEKMLEDDAVNFKPLSWGAYVVDEWRTGESVTFKPNSHYFRASEGLPYVQSLTFRFYSDPDRVIDDILSGNCGATFSDNFTFEGAILQRISELRQAEGDGRIALRYAPVGMEQMVFNITPSEEYLRPSGNGLFDEASLRQAFAYCIDRVALIERHYAGLEPPPDSFLPFEHPDHAAGLPDYEFNPPTGKDLLETLGWVDEDGDGIREKNGRMLSISYRTIDSAQRQAIGADVADMLRENCGINATLQAEPGAKFYGDVLGQKYDVAQFSWMYMYFGGEIPCSLYHADWLSYSGYDGSEFSQACHAARTEQNTGKRGEYIREVQHIFADDLPVIPLFMRLWFGIGRADLKNFNVQPGRYQMQDVESFFIER